LLVAGRSRRIRAIPRPRAERDRELDLVTNDPDFIKKGIELLRELYGEAAVERSLIQHRPEQKTPPER